MIVTHKTQDDFDWMSVIGCPPTCDNYYKNSVWAYDPKRDEIDMIFAEDLKNFAGNTVCGVRASSSSRQSQ